MQISLRANLLSRAIKAKIRLGFDKARSKNLHSLFINHRIAPESSRQHVLDSFLEFFRSLASKGIRANSVSPGTIYFEGGVWHQREQEQPEVFKMALGRNPMGRMGSAEEVARGAVFLASPAASFITGTNLIVDGALTQRVQF